MNSDPCDFPAERVADVVEYLKLQKNEADDWLAHNQSR